MRTVQPVSDSYNAESRLKSSRKGIIEQHKVPKVSTEDDGLISSLYAEDYNKAMGGQDEGSRERPDQSI